MTATPLDRTPTDPDPTWAPIRSALLRANPEFRDAPFSPEVLAGRKPPLPIAPLEGAAFGRLWEVTYQPATFFTPNRLLSVSTAIRWDPPERAIHYDTPWLYIGPRPRIFSRMSPDLERIIERQRRLERNLKGHQTGDAEFDRVWACYCYRSRPAEVLQDPARREWLESLAALRPRAGDDRPTIASLGSVVTLAVVVGDSPQAVPESGSLVRNFSSLLDGIELSTGNLAASQVALTMDFLPDGTGYPSPTLRFQCARCGQMAHPRYLPDFHTEVCSQCRQGLYATW